MPTIIDQRSSEFDNVVRFFESELSNVRTGRASTGVVEQLRVEAYGGTSDLKSIASISIPDAKTIQIEPWDKSLVQAIEKAIIIAELGMQPNTAGTVIRLNIPMMTEENRKHVVKQVHEKAEEARISARNIREEIRSEIGKMEKEKSIGEDEKFRLQEQLDKKVKEINDQIESLASNKEEEIMTI